MSTPVNATSPYKRLCLRYGRTVTSSSAFASTILCLRDLPTNKISKSI
ncbi:unnamed protein product [Brugia timori]|uniref:Uncharacterized protein n=1 Tax=Brugia timori TaxID=42155 RepID=A0A0R3RBS4_9BILA|nr:unnamed protein product [Brugia timori]